MKLKTDILAYLALLPLVFAAASSCTGVEKESASRFSVDKINVDLISSGQLTSGEPATIVVVANKGYEIVSDSDWLSVDKPVGKGRVAVVVTAEKYPSGPGRTGVLTVTSGEYSTEVTVNQTASPFPAFGYVYFADDFSWLNPYISAYNEKNANPIGDSVKEAKSTANAPNIHTLMPELIEDLTARGYVELNPEAACLYLQDAYFKFGKTAAHNGFILPALDLKATSEDQTDVELSFDWCAHTTGSGNVDKMSIQVEIVSGPGNVILASGDTAKKSAPVETTQKKGEYKWMKVSVNLTGVAADTKIVIRPAEMYTAGAPDQQRWHLDNIKIVKVPAL